MTLTDMVNVPSHNLSIVPKGAFYGRGMNGPEMCITDDCTAERTAIQIPNYIYVFFIFSKVGGHGYGIELKKKIGHLSWNMVFTRSKEELEEQYTKLVDCVDSFVQRYPKVLERLETFWERRSEWALSFRVGKIFRHNHTNNYAEAGIRVIKEIVFGRLKAYNLVQMFDFFTMERYYTTRLLDIAHSRFRPGIALAYTNQRM